MLICKKDIRRYDDEINKNRLFNAYRGILVQCFAVRLRK